MKKNIIKAIPILFIICIIIECLNKFISPTPDYMKYITIISTVMSVFALPILIFLWDITKNDSGAGKLGLVLLGIYFILAIITTVAFNVDSISSFDSLEKYQAMAKTYKVFSNIESSVLVLINGLSYLCIIRLLSKKSNDSLVEKVQVVAILSTILYYGFRLLNVWASFDYDSVMYKLPSIFDSLMMYSIISFALMQLVDDTPTLDEVASASPAAQVGSLVNSTGFGTAGMQQGTMDGGLSSTPRFRNPALEQQEAIYNQQNQTAYQDPNAYAQSYQQTAYQDPNAYAQTYQQPAYQDPNAYNQQYQQTAYQDSNVYNQQQTAYQDQTAYTNDQAYQQQPVMQPMNQTGMQ